MAPKFVLTGIAALVVAGTVMVGGLSTPAQANPRIAVGEEAVTTFYNNAQHSEIVGVRYLGTCVPAGDSWGTFSAYSTFKEYYCTPPGGNPPPG